MKGIYLLPLLAFILICSCSGKDTSASGVGSSKMGDEIWYKVWACFPDIADGKQKDPPGPYGLNGRLLDEKGHKIEKKAETTTKSTGWSCGVTYEFDELMIVIVFGYHAERCEYLVDRTRRYENRRTYEVNGFDVYAGQVGTTTKHVAIYKDAFYLHTSWLTSKSRSDFIDKMLEGFDVKALETLIG